MAPSTRKHSDRPQVEPSNEGLLFNENQSNPEQRIPKDVQNNGPNPAMVNVPSFTRQLAQVLSNPEDEFA
ncbi:hypothetical protein RHMOL_Rhmol11G0009800 [Rhododendron molle]|uniref:Uncharacterized protein n=1 Tax=Rhododendron molle TaxID=49168 RepID=A0ACC0LMP2_RHOML|nr:hypothetical protein RHMOL_Rhmol11G0009800 [Rhododendron molle]